MISIVIPTYNEEKYIPKLLESIRKQDFKDYEIIVADSSNDNTKKIAKKYGCKITEGGNPAKARNYGAKAAKYDLLFLDSDVILPEKFLSNFLKLSKEFEITTINVIPTTNKFSHKIYYNFKNWLNRINPIKHCSGRCVFIRRKIFLKIKGYDETLFLGEEHDLVQRAVKNGARFKFLSELYVYNSPRRIEKEGFFVLSFKSIYSEGYRLIFGKMRKKIINYDYKHS